jgi:hypothetical protein
VDSIAHLTDQPAPLTVGGKVYQVHTLTFRDFGKLQKFLDERAPNPLAAIKDHIAGFPPEVQRYMVDKAMADARKGGPKIGTPEASEQLNSAEGVAEVLYLAISRGDAGFTRDDAAALLAEVHPLDAARALERAFGVPPEDAADAGAGAGASGPKA